MLLWKILSHFLLLPLLISCQFFSEIEEKARVINNYERTALNLAKENILLHKQINELQYEVQTLKSKITYQEIKLQEQGPSRKVASVKAPLVLANDQVQFATFHWSPEQLLSVGQDEFQKKNYRKSAQFFQTFIHQYPNHSAFNDEVLFQAGVASYEAGEYLDWSLANMEVLLERFPDSPYYRGAKLWRALGKLKNGDTQGFYLTVDEFRKKYRNTIEWQILSKHYEKIVQKYRQI